MSSGRLRPGRAPWMACGVIAFISGMPAAWSGMPAAAPSATTQSPRVEHARSRATPPGTTVGVLYFDILNPGGADELLDIESPAAQSVEMHSTTSVGGLMQMRQTRSVAVPAGGRVAFEPGGLHAMLIGLKQPLEAGGRVPMTLVFRHAGRVPAEADVEGLGSGTAAEPVPMTGSVPAPAPVPTSSGYRLAVWPPHAHTPEFKLVDAAGRARTLADYRGRVIVVFFGFVRCPDACPAELFKLSLVMKQLGPVADHVQVLFVTLDPARDTRKVLESYVAAFDPRFAGLTGSTAEIDEAARNFYVEYARVGTGSDYTIDHSASTFVLDGAGRLRLVGTATNSVSDYSHDLAVLAAQ